MNRLLIKCQCDVELEAIPDLRKLVEQVLFSTIHEKKLNHKILLCLSEAVTNIIKHSEPKASKISIRFQQTSQKWVLKIIDDGGCFDPTRCNGKDLSAVAQDLESGRGIGLIHASCEHIEYESNQANAENCLTFSWPVNQKTDRARILLVEDVKSARCLYQNYLQDSYEVLVAKDGEEALEILKRYPVDLVLSDINMPMMDGLSLRSKLTQKSDYELTPFVFLTSCEGDEVRARAASLGIDDYLIKPVSRSSLNNHVERVLQRSHQIVKKITNRINRKISQSFIPRIPTGLKYWKISVGRRDTGAGGGDLLLFQPDEEGSLVAMIDTMGHDESAKFFSYAYGGFISGMMRTAGQPETACHQLLGQISAMAYDDDLLSKATLTGIVFHLAADGKITMASAAHPQPLKIGKDSIESIPVEGILPGLLPNMEYQPIQIRVQEGERIAFYTDGLVESAVDNTARQNLEHQILSTIKDTINVPIDRASRLIMRKFDEIAGTQPIDDTTFVLLEPILD